jgi:ribonuclease HI
METSQMNTAADETQNVVFNEEDRVTVYTDGSCIGNPGPGGYAAILKRGGTRKELAGGDPKTTNNRMELMGAIVALESFTRPLPVTLVTDSQYVINGITMWIDRWKVTGWKGSDRKLMKNADLWQRLDMARQRHQVEWRWVRGHSGDQENTRADALANAEAEKMRKLEVTRGPSAAEFGFD